MNADTIVAIATPAGKGGIGVVRLSGPASLKVALKLFRFRDKPAKRKTVEPNYLYFGTVTGGPHPFDRLRVEPALSHQMGEGKSQENPPAPFHKGGQRSSENIMIDHGYMAYFRAPNSYTGEDVVEFQLHGSPTVLRQVVELCIEVSGGVVRLAQPGEYTRRAFINGKIDLSQAEGIADLIDAQTRAGSQLATHYVQGELFAKVTDYREGLLSLLAQIQGDLNFPEDDVPEASLQKIRKVSAQTLEGISQLVQDSRHAWVYRDGLRAAIIGFPNEGKSSLFNALLGRDRAIVSPICGTTRDAIEDMMDVRGVPVVLSDTAGLTKTEDSLERMAMERSIRAIEQADIVLLVIDARDGAEGERLFWESLDPAVATEIRRHFVMRVYNKIDLYRGKPPASWKADEAWVSGKMGKHIGKLREHLVREYMDGSLERGELLVTNMRHMELLRAAQTSLSDALAAATKGYDSDTISIDLERAVGALGEIIGVEVHEELLEQIFSRFCIGK